MAFKPAQLISIQGVLQITPDALDLQLREYAGWITSDVETAVSDLLDRYEAIATDYVGIEPKESNYGVHIDPYLERGAIRRDIANLLGFADMVRVGQAEFIRG